MRMESSLGTLNTVLYMNKEVINKCVGTLNTLNDSMQLLVRSFSSLVYCNVLLNQRSRFLVVLDLVA